MNGDDDDRVPPGMLLDLDEALRVLDALESARDVLKRTGTAPGLVDELATVLRIVHGRLGLGEGGVP